ncbi:MAG TPA: hypothetical protein VHG89_12060 [Verrucomicrobiae bacterium]|nr:hypothetical protein [Verrucomicrobiae bacterium]
MKTLIIILLAATAACASTYFVVANQKAAQLKAAQAAWNAEKAQLEAAQSNAPAVTHTTVIAAAQSSAPVEESPEDIINDLLALKLGSGAAHNGSLRMVVYKLESLAQRGPAAVPAIRAFIGRNVDIDYSVQPEQNTNDAETVAANANGGNDQTNANNGRGGNRRNRGGFGQGGFGGFGGGGFAGGFGGGRRGPRNLQNLRTDWVAPPSLRLGLVGALQEIGGPEAEQALAEMLSSTARGVEVAYLARVLDEMAPGKYRDAACAAAKELLLNPPAVDDPDRLDNLSEGYLFGVLEMFQDASFAPNAEQMLVGADGRLDQDALDYLMDVLKDQAISALYAASQNSNLTNQFDKMTLDRQILNYVGANSQADTLFKDTLNNTNIDARVKTFVVAQLAGGGFGPFAAASPTDPQMVNGRIQLLNQLQSQYANDQQMSQTISATIDALQNGQSVDMRQLFGGGRRGGGGGFGPGGFGGGNGGNGGGNNGGDQ